MKLTKLGLIAISMASMGAPVAALAQLQTYYHAGAWEAFSGRNDKGGPVCGISNTNPADNRRVTIRFDIGGTDTIISASKPNWSIPDNAHVTVVMQVGLNTPWTEQGGGHGNAIDWPIDPSNIRAFYQQFRGASSMTLTFPDGNEPPWTVPLTGSSAITDTIDRCVRDLTRQVQAGQVSGGGTAPPASPSAPTQPFSPNASAPPPGAPQPDASPPATQPTH